ncbi:Hint domain-containing protein, partial [Streptomyces wuyuanensis]|uniref:Hint domain-containing protein n=1 Tax=Streptomyces wuyuanensis TaxID=1196353 RepID=UPI00382D67EB
ARREAARKAAAAKRAAAQRAAARAAAKRAAARRAAAQARAKAQRAAAKRAAAKRAAARKAAARPKPRPKPRSQPKTKPKPSQAKRPARKAAKEAKSEAKEQAKEAVQGEIECRSNGNSFTPGTLVVMADGSTKPIEKVKTGDKVLATDPKTGKTSAQMASSTIVGKGEKHLVSVDLALHKAKTDKSGQPAKTMTVKATEGHPFWVASLREWVKASDLKPGQWLQTSAGTWIQVKSVKSWTTKATVHNLTVTDTHTYYVRAGSAAVLVHNCKSDDDLQKDADALHETVRDRYGDRAYNGTTVTTAELNGELVYAVNRNKTNPEMRALAEQLGYRRVSGRKFTGPNQTDAEQILLNAVDNGAVGSSGRMATSRIPCGPERQNCRTRIPKYPGIRLVGRFGG